MASADPTAKKKPQFSWRHVLVAFVIVLLVTWAVQAFHNSYWLSWPEGEGAAGPVVPREPFERVWSERRVKLVGIGDSITAGFGVEESHSYFGRLVSNPSDDPQDVQGIHLTRVFTKIESLNLSRHGSNSLDHLGSQVPALPVQDEEVLGIVVMTTGGNDIIHDYGRRPPREGAMYGATLKQAKPWIESFEKRLHTMLDEVVARFPGGCEIFLANIFDPTDGTGGVEIIGFPEWQDGLKVLAAYNEIIERAAAERENVHFVDIRTPFLGHGLDCRKFWRKHYKKDDPHFWYAPILEDPNARGYDAIRRLFLIEMAKVLPTHP